ncbi:Aste57867_15388 [Aphanomyces stellatus]|uniref:Aste57867_15388 protein n=1 Tax=Aphanomyces stellatus TaxID=120398 RepID=A0A485L3Z8_9STRA|nr:hypothetical protein As57867_015332 [Aphanomyces stellatus]VFT92194.1 Aste57867_15388 [Aphanomyces stellatus]
MLRLAQVLRRGRDLSIWSSSSSGGHASFLKAFPTDTTSSPLHSSLCFLLVSTMKTTALAFAAVAALATADDALMTCTNAASALITATQGKDLAMACEKEAGISLDSKDVTDAIIKKINDAKACDTWWKANVAAINKITPACDMVNPFAAVPGTIVKTDKFAVTLTEFTASLKQLAAAAGGNTGDKPVTGDKPAGNGTKPAGNGTKPSGNSTGTITKPAATTAAAAATTAAPPATTAKSSSVATIVSAAAIAVVAAFFA